MITHRLPALFFSCVLFIALLLACLICLATASPLSSAAPRSSSLCYSSPVYYSSLPVSASSCYLLVPTATCQRAAFAAFAAALLYLPRQSARPVAGCFPLLFFPPHGSALPWLVLVYCSLTLALAPPFPSYLSYFIPMHPPALSAFLAAI